MNPHPLHRPWKLPAGLLAIVFFLFAGCTAASSTKRMDPHFGQYLETGLAAQVLNPEAPADQSPADGLPGDLAGQIYNKRYIKTMTEEKKENEDTAGQLSGLD